MICISHLVVGNFVYDLHGFEMDPAQGVNPTPGPAVLLKLAWYLSIRRVWDFRVLIFLIRFYGFIMIYNDLYGVSEVMADPQVTMVIVTVY
jgi:hypothetical protein